MACAAQPNCCTCPWGRACISGDMLRALPIVCVCAIALALPDRADPLLGNYWESPPLIGGHTGQVHRSTAARRAARCRRTARARRQAARPPHDPHTRCSRASSRASSTGACAIRDRQERLGRDAPTSRPGPCYTAPADTPRTSLCAPQRGWGASLGPHHCCVPPCHAPHPRCNSTNLVDDHPFIVLTETKFSIIGERF